MLSYRHGFHAGNHADVLKHVILTQTLQYFCQKEAPFWYVDTHSGGGLYDLGSDQATKLAEHRAGIERLWGVKDVPEAVGNYLQVIAKPNRNGKLQRYPGSPWIANELIREQDKLRLFELHGTEFRALRNLFKDPGRRVQLANENGLVGLKALLPPPTRRALVLIDPSYETKSDYQDVVSALKEALKRFPTGTYAIWYPQLARTEARQLPDKLKALPLQNWVNASIQVSKPAKDGFGMFGSGMFIINPPWTLHGELEKTLPWLSKTLAQDEKAQFTLEHRVS